MKEIRIVDTTLGMEERGFGFKDKLEIARQLEKLEVNVIELSEIRDERADMLLIRTAASLVKKSTLSVAAGSNRESIEKAISALNSAIRGRIRIELPLSPVGMEYTSRKKPDAMLRWISESVAMAKESGKEVEFCAVDATRAEKEFLIEAIKQAEVSGADCITVCDCAAEMLPDDFASLIQSVLQTVSVPVGVRCNNKNGLASAAAVLAVRAGASYVKTDVAGVFCPLESFAEMIKNCGNHYGFSVSLRQTELHRILKQIRRVTANVKEERSAMIVEREENKLRLDENDSQEVVMAAVAQMGFDLSEEDSRRVYEEFLRVAVKKKVGYQELDAIVASVALQVPPTFKLVNYVVNNGNIITATAQITLSKGEEMMQGVCVGDGPVDAAFRAIDQIIGHHYELDDFRIQSVTEGKEAVGSALVKLRAAGKVYSGNGISTDIIGAGIRAYLNAVNKIVYEEA